MLSNLKCSFWGFFFPRTPKFEDELSHKQLPTLWVSTFYVEQFECFILEVPPAGGPPNLVRLIVSKTTSCIVNFNFLG